MDQAAVLPLPQVTAGARLKGIAWIAVLLPAFVLVPFIGNDYWFSAVLVPWLVFSLAGLGLNILTGYTGQLSVGSAAFMAIGAYATYNFALRVPGLPLVASFALGGVVAAVFGVIVGSGCSSSSAGSPTTTPRA